MGLLKPQRTGAGYRLYTGGDLERLEQIVALKFLGLPLKEIKVVLDRGPMELGEALRVQRMALEDKRRLLDRAIKAIDEAQRAVEPGKPANPLILKKLIEEIAMQDSVDVMKQYYSEEAWLKSKRYYVEEPSAEWKALYRDVEAALGEDPAGATGQELAARWVTLLRRDTEYDPQVIAGMMKAWMDRQNWPTAIQQRAAEYNLFKVRPYIQEAIVASQKIAMNNDEKWDKLMVRASWNSLLFEANAAVDADPAGEGAQRLVSRFEALSRIGGGPKEATPEGIRTWLGGHECSRFIGLIDVEQVVEFLNRAVCVRPHLGGNAR